MPDDVEHLFMRLRTICLSLEKCLHKVFAYFEALWSYCFLVRNLEIEEKALMCLWIGIKGRCDFAYWKLGNVVRYLTYVVRKSVSEEVTLLL